MDISDFKTCKVIKIEFNKQIMDRCDSKIDFRVRSLKELDRQQKEGRIDLYYADESHICTEGYVPYGWQFPDEDVYIASGRTARLNIFGMIDRKNKYKV